MPPPAGPRRRLSLITPSYQAAEYLEETIRSVAAQGWEDLEYIMIDGGSSDETAAIADHYSPWINHFVSEPDSGQADAINKGLRLATGEFVNWLNADDLLTPGALAEVARLGASCDIAAGATEDFDWRGRTRILSPRGLRFEELVRQGAGGDVLFHQPSIWIRRSHLLATGPLATDLHFKFDFDMLLRLLANRPRVAYTQKVLARFRLHDASKTVGSQPKFLADHVKVLQRLRENEALAEFHSNIEQPLRDKRWQLYLATLMADGQRSRWARLRELHGRVREDPAHRCGGSARRAAQRILLKGRHTKTAKMPGRPLGAHRE